MFITCTTFHLVTIRRSKDMMVLVNWCGIRIWLCCVVWCGVRTARLVYKALYCTRRSDVQHVDMKTSLVSYGDNLKIVVLEYGSPNKLGDYYHHFIGRQSCAVCLFLY